MKRFKAISRSDPGAILSMPRPDVIEALQSDSLRSIQVLEQACAAYAGRPALGERALAPDGAPLPEFRTISYQALWRRTADLATGLARDPRTALRPGEIAGICGFGSVDYVVADMACLYAGVASAVLQVGMAARDLEHIINEARLAVVFCAPECLGDVLGLLPRCPSVRSLVAMEARAGAVPQDMAGLEALGRASAPLAPFIPAAGTDPLATLMYTSGSTGFPKGALMTESVWRAHWRLRWLDQLAQFPAIGLNFYPLSHVLGRNALLRTLVLGGVTHFTLKSDLSTLFEDIRLVRPTFLNLVPRISEMIHHAFRAEAQRRARAGLAPAAAREQVLAEWRGTFLGDRLVAALVGSAPTAPETLAWLAECFEIPVYEGYGSTEGGIVTIDGEISRPAVVAYRLEAQPELGYRLGDRPWPRGELLVKTLQSVPGYFNNPEATRALYTEDGFLRTGDIVEERGPDRVAWIDRKNNVLKLAQGEFVTLWRLEATFSGGSPCLDQVYLYADSRRAFLLAVLVPAWDAVDERLGLEGRAAPAAVKRLLRAELNRVAAEARLRPFEVPRDFLVEPGRWTRENGFLTGINKHARPRLKQHYGGRLEELYARLDREQDLDPAALGLLDPGLPLAEKARRAVAAVLGVPDLDLAAGSFKDLGGDSVGALSLALLLEEACGRPVPASAILNPGRPLRDLVLDLEEGRGQADGLPGFDAVHGREAAEIRQEDLNLDRFLRPGDLAEAAAVAAGPLPPVRTVLLTGASGFLGRILCLEWMERLAGTGGKVWALVRAADDGAAAERMRAACRGDRRLEERFAHLAGRHLAVLAGDLAAPRLGLTAPAYKRLAAEVDLIVHAGALVNHSYTYEQLFEPNVLGTARLIRLALHGRRKRFDDVSTLGVLAGARGPGGVLEQDGVAALQAAWPAKGGYAHGYAASKWAAEVLLRELHQRFQAPVRVFRPGMILPDRRYRGQVNAPDMLSRLLASVAATGLAPRSFYAGPAPAQYDGLPVDFVAAAMVALSSAWGEGLATYHMSNPHGDDAVSLDTLMDWVASAGIPIRRVDDHAAWFEAFSARLGALPPEARQRSAWPVREAWARPAGDPAAGRADAGRFIAEVRRLKPGGEPGLPRLTEDYVHRYLEDLQALDLLQSS